MAGNGNSGGRNAKSPEQHREQGTYQRVRHDGFEFPDPPKGKPVPHKKLSAVAQAEWDRTVSRMEQSKTSSVVDDAALYQYVCLFEETEELQGEKARIRKLAKSLQRKTHKLNGLELVEAIKQIVNLEYLASKLTMQLRQGHLAVKQYEVELGITPSARGRVKIQKQTERKSKLLAFTGGKAETKTE